MRPFSSRTAMAVAVIGVLVTVPTLNQGFTIKNKIINLILIDLNRCAEATQRQTNSEICSERGYVIGMVDCLVWERSVPAVSFSASCRGLGT